MKKSLEKDVSVMRKAIIQALKARYQAQISEADATLKIFLDHPVGIGEHPQHLEEVEKLIKKISSAKGKLETLKNFE